MPNVIVDLPNVGGAICSTLQSLVGAGRALSECRSVVG